METRKRAPLSMFKKIIIIIFCVVSSFGIYDSFFPSKTPAPTKSSNPNNVFFEHPSLKYTLEFPKDWKKDIIKNSPHEDFNIRSKNFKKGTMGSEIFIRAQATKESDIEEVFNRDPLGPKIARNRTLGRVDGARAIQFDYDYRGTKATHTIFIKNGVYYLVRHVYANEKDKQADKEIYLTLLASLRTN